MAILCGTDFSALSDESTGIAATLAEKAGEPLVLLHVLPEHVPGFEERDAADEKAARAELDARTKALNGEVRVRIERGLAGEVIPQVAEAAGARLIVVTATSRRVSRWLLGTTADRVASQTAIPVLVVRSGFPAAEWVSGRRRLEVVIASDLSAVSDQAIAWAAALRAYGDCRFTIAHVAWPPEIFHRLGIEGPLLLDATHPSVEPLIQRELDAAAARIGGAEIAIVSPVTKPSDALVRLADERNADLVVVGHHPTREWRTWEASVARSVMRSATVTVACAPQIEIVARRPVPRLQRLVAATDLSPAGNAAAAWALNLVPPDGRVTIVHVLEQPEPNAAERQRIIDGLREMGVDRSLTERRVDVRIELVDDASPAFAIARIAEREEANLICIATQGRSRLPRILLGAVAQELLLTSRIPVLMVPPPREYDGASV
ncbi:MAG: universal stress protein [Thermoanaerobaculia bacterium]